MELMVTGASGGIGRALVDEGQRRGFDVLAVTRQSRPLPAATETLNDCPATQYPERLGVQLARLEKKPRLIIHCGGLLHDGAHQPEKRLLDIDPAFFQRNMERNCLDALLLLQTLASHYQRDEPFRVALLSARVGSIGDNGLGGWYSYRMSKAALNMLVKTTAIEWQRTHPQACVVAQHPGTTDTELSKPFQRNIPAARLYPPTTTAARLLNLLECLSPEHSGRLLNWDGSTLPW